jgi:hypothetical protein
MFVIYQLRIYTAQVSNSRVRVYVCVCVYGLCKYIHAMSVITV